MTTKDLSDIIRGFGWALTIPAFHFLGEDEVLVFQRCPHGDTGFHLRWDEKGLAYFRALAPGVVGIHWRKENLC